MFLFYGKYDFREKETPIIHAIRKSVVSGRHRFTMAKHQLAYDIFAEALNEHPSWEEFLDDRGKGTTPPEFPPQVIWVLFDRPIPQVLVTYCLLGNFNF